MMAEYVWTDERFPNRPEILKPGNKKIT